MIPEAIMFAEGKEDATKRNYLAYGRKLSKFLQENNLTLRTMQPIDVKKFVHYAGTKGTNKQKDFVMNTAAIYKQYIISMLLFVGSKKEVVDYVRRNLREIKKVSKFKVDLKTEEIIFLLTATKQPELRLAWSLMAFNGLRAGEFLSLHYSDINTTEKTITLQRREGEPYHPKGMKLGQKPLKIPLDDLSIKLFKKLQFRPGERIYPFTYKTLRKYFVRYMKDAKIVRTKYPLTMHKLRHFFAHYWRKHKGDITLLKSILRHTDIKYTLLYSEPTDVELEVAFRQVMDLKQRLKK